MMIQQIYFCLRNQVFNVPELFMPEAQKGLADVSGAKTAWGVTSWQT